MTILGKIVAITGALVMASIGGWIVSRKLIKRASPVPNTIGLIAGRLAPCPASPNCVSTQADDVEHHLDPIPYTLSLTETRTVLLEIVWSLPRTDVLSITPNYIHAISQTLVFGFLDDTEIYIDDEAKLIHLRTAARLGYGDRGLNRRRAEKIVAKFKDMTE
ncbi:MAG: DUF1499 domain-containing protein [Anaerolineaceae bacterium]|nr:DUF1499 domain-containing protein [Anaerolineaceae bacterium]MCB9101735.1 DUF1499 domain-containing protein [Anaerolineales bacterium]